MMKSAVIIPTYNEVNTIGKIIDSLVSRYPEIDVYVVDDNSPDGTSTVVKKMILDNKHIFLLNRQKKEGLGKAYVFAFNKILEKNYYSTVITMDSDMSHNPVYLEQMIKLRNEYDIVIGSRYVKGGKTVGWEMWRRALSYFGNLYIRLILRLSIKDLTSGYVAISTDILKKVNLDKISSSGYAYTIESKYLFYSHNAKIKEIPITFTNRIFGESKITNHIIKEGITIPWRIIFKHD